MTASSEGPSLEDALRRARGNPPASISEWKKLAEGLLTEQPCVFHRNLEISSLYAGMYRRHPDLFKWAGMAAFASHHVRVALYPMRLAADRRGFVDLPRGIRRFEVLRMSDFDTIRRTNNAIFNDIFWLHLAYDGCAEGLARLRSLVAGHDHYEAALEGFEAVERGRLLAAEGHAEGGEESIWEGNIQILRHEQEAVVQPAFLRLSTGFARLFSMGSSLDFEVRGLRQQARYFTSFLAYMLARRAAALLRQGRLPRITHLEHRWDWICGGIVPRFRRLDGQRGEVLSYLEGIVGEARSYREQMTCSLDLLRR